MSKITLNTFDGFTESIVTTSNANNTLIQTAVENTLSRDGTSPNQMAADLDMNSNRILNLPQPGSADEPLRLADITLVTGTTLSLPGSSTDNAIVRWNGTGGTSIQNSTVVIDDTGNVDIASGKLGVGVVHSGAWQLYVQQNGGGLGLFESLGANGAAVGINNAAGGNQSSLQFYDAGVSKWQIGKQTDNTFFFYDSTNSRTVISVTAGGALTLNPTTQLTISAPVSATTSGTGTSETKNYNLLTISSDDVVTGTSTPSTDFANGLQVAHNFGGSSAKGGRNAIFANLTQTTTKNASDWYNFNAALLGWVTAAAAVNDSNSYLYGIGTTAHALASSTTKGIIAAEFTVGVESGATTATRAGVIINGLGGAAGTGSSTDALMVLTNQTSSTARFAYGILISNLGTSGCDPIDHSTGVIMSAASGTSALHGIDLSNATFSGGAYKSNAFSVDGSGNVIAHAYSTTGAITAFSGTAVPAGGTTGSGIKFSSASNFGMFFGSGAPTLAAAQGSLYVRSDGSSVSTRLYVNTNGASSWTTVTTLA